ncbi:hypothetical protein F4827_004092 [Paraburkholderia bannensis]|uniref:Uncharacterized protein n=1 Tax=Paraburkholderia bannensis TaxID=765414 RepID=A0A7W9WUX4_9BURK|nr:MULTISPECIES: hypothetical protein [Paraburkholderia]MBB3259218.1 hypothetical protein [Paraburkholderia sp. WP4_3_2]MBB6104233.1 hypothetical protein [Paraburkholderia bannensis]
MTGFFTGTPQYSAAPRQIGARAVYPTFQHDKKIHQRYDSLHHLSSLGKFKLKYRTARINAAREQQHQHKIPADGKPAKMTKAQCAVDSPPAR